MANRMLTRFWVALFSFLCLSLSMLPIGNAEGQQMESTRQIGVSSYQEPNRNYCGSERTARALRRIKSKAVPDLVRALQNQDTKLRADAANLLGSIDKKAASAAIPNLIAASKNDPDAEVRVCAVSALISIAGNDLNKSTPEVKAVIPTVIAALKDSDTEVRLAATIAFQSMSFTYYGNDSKFNAQVIPELKAAIPVLIESLKDEQEQVRTNATSALGNIGSDAASVVPVMTKALKDPDEKVRLGATQVLARIVNWENNSEAASVVPALIAVFKKDKNVEVRSNAAFALRNMGEQAASAVPVLIETLKNDKDQQVRSSAVFALENMGEKAASAVPALIEALQDETLWFSVTQSLGRIAESWQDNASKLSNQDLDKAISDLERALKIVEAKAGFASPTGFADEGKKRLHRSVNFLKKEKISRSLGSRA